MFRWFGEGGGPRNRMSYSYFSLKTGVVKKMYAMVFNFSFSFFDLVVIRLILYHELVIRLNLKKKDFTRPKIFKDMYFQFTRWFNTYANKTFIVFV